MNFVCLKYPKLEMTYKAEIRKEINGEMIKEPRKVIKFQDGYYTTEDKGEIAFIKRHVDFGNGNICVMESEAIQENPNPIESDINTPEPIPPKRGRKKKIE